MRTLLGLGLAALGALASSAPAQRLDAYQRFEGAEDVGIDQKLGAKLPLGLVFRDEHGGRFELGDAFEDRPVVIALVYYECPMLCTLVLNDLVSAMRGVQLELGEDYSIVTVSIDPAEGPELAATKKRRYLGELDGARFADAAAAERFKGWRFLTGDEENVKALSDALGFRYAYDAERDEYAHAAGVMVASAEGVVTHYLYGIGYDPRDLKLALVDAGRGQVGSLVDQIVLRCFHYDPWEGRYGFAILTVLRGAALLTVGAIAVFVVRNLRNDRRRKATAGAAA
ncbi:MAG: SCO family protein [Planctomycetes bacterium]|nr:SCO family protein [Planctomycetota bacterium]